MNVKRVGIVGGGPSGLVALRHLRGAGIDAKLFEESPSLGGVWVYDPNADPKTTHHKWARAYASLTTNSSTAAATLSDFELDCPDIFPNHRQMQEYYTGYAVHHGLMAHICFNSPVVKVVPDSDEKEWSLTYVSSETGAPKEITKKFDAVVCATGTFGQPNMDIPWLSSYAGHVVHSAYYRVPNPYKDKHVVVIGLGNSALDISLNLADTCASVTVCSSGATAIIPCFDSEKNLPGDYELLSRQFFTSPNKLARFMEISSKLTRVFKQHGMPANNKGRFSILKKDAEYIEALKSGKIKLRPLVVGANGHELTLSDGSTVHADAIISCTGYRIKFPYLADPPCAPQPIFTGKSDGYHQDYFELYKYVLDPRRPSCAFLGVFDTFGNSPVLAEMQARWVTAVFSGKIALPDLQERLKWTQERKTKDMRRGGTAPMFRDYVPSMLLYAKELGVDLPKLKEWPEENPLLAALFYKENWEANKLKQLRSKL